MAVNKLNSGKILGHHCKRISSKDDSEAPPNTCLHSKKSRKKVKGNRKDQTNIVIQQYDNQAEDRSASDKIIWGEITAEHLLLTIVDLLQRCVK